MPTPQPIAEVLAELMARRGYGRVQSHDLATEAWQAAAGEFAGDHSRVAAVRRGVLDVVVANSTLVQELTFRKAQLVADLAHRLPQEGIRDVRFRVGPIK